MRNTQQAGCVTHCSAAVPRLQGALLHRTCCTRRHSSEVHAFREGWSDNAHAIATWSPAHAPALSTIQEQQKQRGWNQSSQHSGLQQQGQTVLEQALPSLVRFLSTAPSAGAAAPTCLQLVHSSSAPGPRHKQQHLTHELVNLTGRDVTSPQVWQEVAPVSKLQDTLAVILARPIPDPSHFCPLANVQPHGTSGASSQVCGTPSGMPGMQQQQDSRLPDLQGAVDLDNCCGGSAAGSEVQTAAELQQRAHHLLQSDGLASVSSISTFNTDTGSSSDEESKHPTLAAGFHMHSSSSSSSSSGQSRARRRFLRRQAAREAAAATSHATNRVGQVSYYGLAVQTIHTGASTLASAADWPVMQAQLQPDGCYVLKLSKNNDATGCTCTMFTLTHVCRGAPLHQQLLHSWLVHA